MSEQLDRSEGRYYAIERLSQLQKEIIHLLQGMVIQRARVEKYRQGDLASARDTYSELQRTRRQLCQSIAEAQPLLMETEEYRTAAAAEKLRAGLSGFDLMSSTYKPVYDTLSAFANAFPVNETTNAAVVGRLMNNIRLGYYPTAPANIALILRGIHFPEGVVTNLLDPCCGCGKALRQIAEGNGCYTYGVELDENRAEEAQTRLHIYIIPYYRMTPDICRVLMDNFDDLTVWRFTDKEFQRFKQIAVFGVRKHRDVEPQDTLSLEQHALHPAGIPSLEGLAEGRYALPGIPLEVHTFKGEKFNQKELEQQLRRSGSFTQMMARSELDNGAKRPLLPLSISQIGLIGGSGMINGLIECDTPHIIKGRIVKVKRLETEEKFSARGKHMGSEVRETISNKMIFNVLTPNGFKALT